MSGYSGRGSNVVYSGQPDPAWSANHGIAASPYPNTWNTSTSYNPGSMGGGMGQGYSTSISYAPGSMGAPGTMGQNYGSAAGAFQPAYQQPSAPNMNPVGRTPSTPDPAMGLFGDPNINMTGQQPNMSGPVGTGPRATNGLNTISFNDVDNYYRQMMGLR